MAPDHSAHLAASKDKILELTGTKLCRADAKNERDGVHEIGFTATIGTNHSGKGVEGADDLVAAV